VFLELRSLLVLEGEQSEAELKCLLPQVNVSGARSAKELEPRMLKRFVFVCGLLIV